MTQTLKKYEYRPELRFKSRTRYFKNRQHNKKLILDFLYRNVSFLTEKEKIRAISNKKYMKISKVLNVSVDLIHRFISRFLVDLIRIKQYLNDVENRLLSKNQAFYIRTQLHHLYRLAPVFDYKRAKENAKILEIRLEALFFWPRMTTQVAIIIFITDFLDPLHKNKIIQSNLRSFCNCSVYAFHRTRNKIGLNPKNIRKK